MKLASCLSDIREWMCSNLLKLNQDKTELMIFAPKHRAKELTDISISFGGNIHVTPLLAHLAKGNMSFCHHLSSVNFSYFNLLL